MIPAWVKWAVYAALAALLIGGAWYALDAADSRGYARAQAEYQAAALVATAAARERERKLQDQVDSEAKNHEAERQVTQGTIDTLAASANELRAALAARQHSGSGAAAKPTGGNVPADTLTRQLFSECVDEYQKVAVAADRLADGFRITARWGFIVTGK